MAFNQHLNVHMFPEDLRYIHTYIRLVSEYVMADVTWYVVLLHILR